MDPKLNILLLTIGYPPESIGGTEVYVQALAQELILKGCRVTVVIPAEHKSTRIDESLVVHEMPLADFRDFIFASQFDIVHAHPLTASRFLAYLKLCQQQETSIIVTYHTPTLSCGRGDLLLNSQEPCDGEIRQLRCTACILQQKGLPLAVCRLVAGLPVSDLFESLLPVGRLRSMLSIQRQVRQHREDFRQLRGMVRHWIAVSKWVRDVLLINGVLAENIRVYRQAFCHEKSRLTQSTELNSALFGNSFNIGFIGRIHPDKGLHILLKALHYLPDEKIELHVVGDREAATAEYSKLLESEARDDPRIRWWGGIEPQSIPEFLKHIDVLVVPSVWMETGPMTVLEAWEASVPVIGSDRGGIREWLKEYGGGWLFPPGDSRALASILQDFRNKRTTIPAIPVRDSLPSIRGVADQMIDVYEVSVLG